MHVDAARLRPFRSVAEGDRKQATVIRDSGCVGQNVGRRVELQLFHRYQRT